MLLNILWLIVLSVAVALFTARYNKHRKKKLVRRSRETWAIGIYAGSSPMQLYPPPGINNPVLTAKDITDIKARFVADPFMIRHNGHYYLFFEVLNDKRNRGEIGYAVSNDGLQWAYRKIILKELFHLSYPYVFFHDGNYYMIPECMGSGGIQLYQATEFPERWQRIATLIKGNGSAAALVDPSIIHYQNRWYLFSYSGKSKSLHLFTAGHLAGPWKEHPKSPLVSGSPHFSRPGGRVVSHEGVLYRYAQDEIPNYGSRVWAFRITELTKESYSEEAASENPIVEAGHEWWNRDGMHTIDPHQLEDGRWIACVDGFTISTFN